MAAISAAQVPSTESSRAAQSVPACGHASSTADCGSHSAGSRNSVDDMIHGAFEASNIVIPAEAGIHVVISDAQWIPAYAGMTSKNEDLRDFYSECGPGVRNTEWITWLYSKYTMYFEYSQRWI